MHSRMKAKGKRTALETQGWWNYVVIIRWRGLCVWCAMLARTSGLPRMFAVCVTAVWVFCFSIFTFEFFSWFDPSLVPLIMCIFTQGDWLVSLIVKRRTSRLILSEADFRKSIVCDFWLEDYPSSSVISLNLLRGV